MDSSNRNTALWRTAAAFCHPVTIAAVAVMLLNDHLFKAWWPGWWTGKLSDAAWVTFAPLFVALPASFLLPRRLKRRDTIVLWLSLAVTAVSYFLFNSWEPFHQLINAFFSSAFGWGAVARDPTDSITLAALALTWWLWWHPANPSALRSRALVVGAVAALATVATSVAPRDLGISYLAQDGARLVAASKAQNYGSGAPTAYTSAYISSDGGLTWAPMKKADIPRPIERPGLERQVDASGNIQYLFVPGVSVERSDDGGVTWRKDYDLTKVSHQARKLYYEERVTDRLPGTTITALPGPLYALMDTVSGNLVLAMGQDGVLVRTPSGQWTWATVGPYRLEPIGPLELLSLLYGEFLAASAFLVLAFATTVRGLQGGGKGSLVVLALTWLSWFAGIFSFSGGPDENFAVFIALPVVFGAFLAIALTALPHREYASLALVLAFVLPLLIPFAGVLAFLSSSSAGPAAYPLIIVLYVGAVLGFAWAIYRRQPRLLWRIIAAMGVEFVLFVMPLVLWSQGLIAEYNGAFRITAILGVIGVGAAVPYLIRYRRRTPPAAG